MVVVENGRVAYGPFSIPADQAAAFAAWCIRQGYEDARCSCCTISQAVENLARPGLIWPMSCQRVSMRGNSNMLKK